MCRRCRAKQSRLSSRASEAVGAEEDEEQGGVHSRGGEARGEARRRPRPASSRAKCQPARRECSKEVRGQVEHAAELDRGARDHQEKEEGPPNRDAGCVYSVLKKS